MPGAYAYTPAIWLPLVVAVFLVATGFYAWRHRDVPGGKPFLAISAITVPIVLSIALEAAAVAPETRLAHQKLQFILMFAGVIPVACMVLDYAFPGRWLTRRNLVLLSVPFLICLVLVVIDDSRLMWRAPEANASGELVLHFAPAGAIVAAYGVAMFLFNAAVFIYVFIRSPQHRWPVVLMLLGQFGTRVVFLLDTAHLPALSSVDLSLVIVFAAWTGYAIALFGFRILDPLPLARQAVIEQMQAGVVVFDRTWRVASLNPAAEKLLGIARRAARGKTWGQVMPQGEPQPPSGNAHSPGGATELPKMSFGAGAQARHTAPVLSELLDFRGLPLGHMLMLHDVTEEQRARAQALEQGRSLAALRERERLARELHDSTGQVLGYAGLQLEVILDRITDALAALPAGEGAGATAHLVEAEDHATRLGRILEEAHADVREHILNLRLAPSDQRPFFATLRHYLDGYCQNYGIQAELSVGVGVDESRLDAPTQTELFRIIQEALSNARKHAEASRVQITLEALDGRLQMRVEDNGRGFDPAQAMGDGDGHYGLRTMHERAEQLGGQLSVRSAPGAGTCVIADLPIGGHPSEERP